MDKSFLQKLITAGLLLMLVACASVNQQDLEAGIQTHPLIGQIWQPTNKRFVTQQELLDAVVSSDFILLGETHDNIAHHIGQQRVVEYLKSKGISASVTFEMIDDKQAAQLKVADYHSADELIGILKQEPATWPYDEHYKSLFAAVIAAGYPIHAANLNRQTLMSLFKQGNDALPENLQVLTNAVSFDKAQQDSMVDEIKESHCGMLHDAMVKPLINGQRIRDASMAQSMLSLADKGKVVLISGSGHARNDRGVPVYLKSQLPQAKILSIAWMEVTNEAMSADEYAKFWKAEQMPFDFVWFTPRIPRPDPCEELKQHAHKFKSMKGSEE